MFRRIVVAALAVSIAAAGGGAGCGPGQHSHGGQLVTEYPARKKPAFGWTRVPAVYVLYAQKERPEGYPDAVPARIGWELTSLRLKKRSPLGFKLINGNLVAVAGEDEIPLPTGEYCWHTRPYSEPIDWVETVAFGALVAGAAVGIYAAVWRATTDMF